MKVLKNKFEIKIFENYLKIKVLKIRILGNYLRTKFKKKINLRIDILKNYLEREVLKIKFGN